MRGSGFCSGLDFVLVKSLRISFVSCLVKFERRVSVHVVRHVWVELVRQVLLVVRVAAEVLDQFGASCLVYLIVLLCKLLPFSLLQHLVFGRGLAVVSPDAICDLLASSSLLGGSSSFWSFRCEVVHWCIVRWVRDRCVVLGLSMAIEFLSVGVIKVECIYEAEFDSFSDVSPSSLGVPVVRAVIHGVFILCNDPVHVQMNLLEELLSACNLFFVRLWSRRLFFILLLLFHALFKLVIKMLVKRSRLDCPSGSIVVSRFPEENLQHSMSW